MTTRLTIIKDQLVKQSQEIFESSSKVRNIFYRDVFKLSDNLKSPYISVLDAWTAISKKGESYEGILT